MSCFLFWSKRKCCRENKWLNFFNITTLSKKFTNFAICEPHGHEASMVDRGPAYPPETIFFRHQLSCSYCSFPLFIFFLFLCILSFSCIIISNLHFIFSNLKAYYQCSVDEYVNCTVNWLLMEIWVLCHTAI